MRQRDGFERLGQRADLVDLDQQRIGQALFDPHRQALRVGDEEVVADQLNAAAQLVGHGLPAFEIVFGHAVLDGADRVSVAQVGEVIRHLRRGKRQALPADLILPVLEELARGRIERHGDVLAWLEPGLLDRAHDEVQRGARAGEIGRETALVTHRGGEAFVVQAILERVEHFRAPPYRLGQRRRADGHDHEFLEVDRVVGVLAAVDDVHHRHRQHVGRYPADVGIERQPTRIRRRLGDRQADAEDGVGAEVALVVAAVERDHRQVDLALVFGVEAEQRIGKRAVDRVHGLEHALAEIARLVAVAQFDRFVRPGRGARGDRGAAEAAVFEQHVHLHRRIAPAVEDFAAVNVDDGGHEWGSGVGVVIRYDTTQMTGTGRRLNRGTSRCKSRSD